MLHFGSVVEDHGPKIFEQMSAFDVSGIWINSRPNPTSTRRGGSLARKFPVQDDDRHPPMRMGGAVSVWLPREKDNGRLIADSCPNSPIGLSSILPRV